MMLTCPRDGKPVMVYALEGSTVRRCWTCHGLWIGYVALERLTHLRVRNFLKAKANAKAAMTALRCPVEGRPLAPVRVADVEIDVCPECKGTWLDHLELERIRRRLPPPAAPEPGIAEAGGDAIDAADAAMDIDIGSLRRFWRWIEDQLPGEGAAGDGGGADFDFD